MSKIAVIAKLPVKPGTRTEFVEAFSAMFPVVADEPGTEVYVLHTDLGDENLVWVYELYADDAALDAHSSSDGMKAAIGAFGGFLAGAPEISRLAPVGGKGLDV
ncbi:MAG: putative quinol monooxygenase [Acidimicrobiales bacterium]